MCQQSHFCIESHHSERKGVDPSEVVYVEVDVDSGVGDCVDSGMGVDVGSGVG